MYDGNNGGQRYTNIKVMKTNLLLSKALGRFTLMCLTAATSDPVLCICILYAKSLSVTDVKGFNYRASIPYESSKTMVGNMVKGKELPGLPVFKIRGKSIPDLMCMPPKGSIRSKILTEVLKYLDQLNVFERRKYGPNPFGYCMIIEVDSSYCSWNTSTP